VMHTLAAAVLLASVGALTTERSLDAETGHLGPEVLAPESAIPRISRVYYLSMPSTPRSKRELGLLENLAEYGFSPSQITRVDGFTLRQNVSDPSSPWTAAANAALSSMPSPVRMVLAGAAPELAKVMECQHADNYYSTTGRSPIHGSAKTCSNVVGLLLGTLRMYMMAGEHIAEVKAADHQSDSDLVMFLQDDARLLPRFRTGMEQVLGDVPMGTWDILNLHGGGTPFDQKMPMPEYEAQISSNLSSIRSLFPDLTGFGKDRDYLVKMLFAAKAGIGPHFGNAAQLMPADRIEKVFKALTDVPFLAHWLKSGKAHIDVMQVAAHQSGSILVHDSTQCLAYPTGSVKSSMDGQKQDVPSRVATPPRATYHASECNSDEL